jgi:DNA/RNA-binding domain of Phe-tRNA-synthetase-like protein
MILPTVNLPTVALPGLALHALVVELPAPLAELPSPAWLVELLRLDAPAPVRGSEALRTAVRDLLRTHGYRPTGRGKPSSEYLVGAVGDGRLGSINAVVDAGNVASLHSGLPISVVDLDLVVAPLRVAVPPMGSKYVFNRGGQEIDVGGLLCLEDAEGPCANAVKDAQRTKTTPATRRVLAVVWGCVSPDAAHAPATARWLAELCTRLVAVVTPAVVDSGLA